MKTCRKCGLSKTLAAFTRDKKTKDGLHPYCRACRAEYHQKRAANPEARAKMRAQARRYYSVPENRRRQAELRAARLQDPVERAKARAAVQRCYEREMADPARRKLRSEAILLRRRGLTKQQRDDIFAAQDCRCAICRTDAPTGAANRLWHIDHCHKTKRVRGILCGNCNNALGFIRESETSALALLAYIRERCSTDGSS